MTLTVPFFFTIGRSLITLLLSIVLFDLSYGQPRIKTCSQQEKEEIENSWTIIREIIDDVFDDYQSYDISNIDLSKKDKVTSKFEKYKRMLKKRWEKVKIKCSQCRSSAPGSGGFVHSQACLRGRKIKICYQNLVDAGLYRQSLINTMVHEGGHLADMPKLKGHARPHIFPHVYDSDPVYLLGRRGEIVFGQKVLEGLYQNPLLRN